MVKPTLAEQLAAAQERVNSKRNDAPGGSPSKRDKDIEAKSALRRGLKGVFS